MERFGKETQEIINRYIIKALENKDNYNKFKDTMEDFAMEIINITCTRMIDPD